MARTFPYVCKVGEQSVGYSAARRSGRWEVYFRHGEDRVRRLTRAEVRGRTPGPEFHEEAHQIITAAVRPPDLFPEPRRLTWGQAIDEVVRTAPHVRDETVRSFRAAAKALVETCPDATEPTHASEERVKRFCRLWLAAPGKKGKGGGRRSPTTLSYYCRALSALTNHLIDLGWVERNPWRGIKVPKAERDRQPVPTEEDVSHFFAWLTARYPGWQSLRLFFEAKAVCGCRTMDLCKLPAAALSGGRLTFPAATVKTKEGRSVLLPPDLFAALARVAGREFLWGRLYAEIPLHRKQSNGLPDEFSPRTVYYVVNNVAREYSDAHPDKPRFKPHGLRRRAITQLVMATDGNVDLTARTLGINPTTARNHYLDAKQAFDADETMKRLAEVLRPKGGANANESTINPPPDGRGG